MLSPFLQCAERGHVHEPEMSPSTGSPHTWTSVSILSLHHLTHVTRGVVGCLHDRAKGIINTQDNHQKEYDPLARVIKQNSYLQTLSVMPLLIDNIPHYLSSAPLTQETADMSSHDKEQEEKKR